MKLTPLELRLIEEAMFSYMGQRKGLHDLLRELGFINRDKGARFDKLEALKKEANG